MPVQFFNVAPTVTAGAYSTNDVVGGLMTFKGLRRGSLQTVTITDKAAQSADYLLVLFNDTPTLPSIVDNATYDINDADLPKIIHTITLTAAASRTAFSDNAIYTVSGLDVPIQAQCPSISAYLIATASAPTYASTSDITVVLQVDTDYVSGRNQGSSNINAIQVGDAAGGELSGTYPVPAVNATHSGSSHLNLPAGVQANGINLMTISSSNNVTNKTIDADNNTITNLAHGAEVDDLTTSHGATGAVVGTTNSQTLTNKTLTSPSISGPTITGVAGFADGTEANPSIMFTSDTNTGLYSFAANEIGFSGGAGVMMDIASNALTLANGVELNLSEGIIFSNTVAVTGTEYNIQRTPDSELGFNVATGGTHMFTVNNVDRFKVDVNYVTALGIVDSSPCLVVQKTPTANNDMLLLTATGAAGADAEEMHLTFSSRNSLDGATYEIGRMTGVLGSSGSVSGSLAFWTKVFAGALTKVVEIDNSGDLNLLTGGLNFPNAQVASADANTLDDYEEGTWTPALDWATTGDSVRTISTNTANYVKVGKKVTLFFDTTTSTMTHTTASGALTISGLPFTAVAGHYPGGTLSPNGISYPSGYTTVSVHVASGAATATLWADGSGVNQTTITTAEHSSGTNVILRGTLTYITA